MGIDVLNLEWKSSSSRDRMSSTLVSNYLKFQGLSVHEGSAFNGFSLINRWNPRLVFMGASSGADLNMSILRYTKSLGLFFVGGTAEGNFKESVIDAFIWGRSTDRILLEDRWLLWSQRVKKMVEKYYPELEGQLRVSGGHGFDQYKIKGAVKSFNGCEKLRKFKHIVGVGCWDFGGVFPEDYRYIASNIYTWSDENVNFYRNDREYFNAELLELIKNNPTVGFLLKEHPGRQLGHFASGIEGCDQFDNVVIVQNEITIQQAIGLADVWLSYESTTALEAWLMGKPTGLLNPSGTEFPARGNVHFGQPNFTGWEEWSDALDTLFNGEGLPGFSVLADERNKIIQDTIQWDDGLNHVRFGNVIIDLLNSGREPIPFPKNAGIKVPSLKQRFRQFLVWTISRCAKQLPFVRSLNDVPRKQWDDAELKAFQSDLMEEQLAFYQSKGLSKDELEEIQAI